MFAYTLPTARERQREREIFQASPYVSCASHLQLPTSKSQDEVCMKSFQDPSLQSICEYSIMKAMLLIS
jgi:hypothetical protein